MCQPTHVAHHPVLHKPQFCSTSMITCVPWAGMHGQDMSICGKSCTSLVICFPLDHQRISLACKDFMLPRCVVLLRPTNRAQPNFTLMWRGTGPEEVPFTPRSPLAELHLRTHMEVDDDAEARRGAAQSIQNDSASAAARTAQGLGEDQFMVLRQMGYTDAAEMRAFLAAQV
jgi:hypothetical protein